VTATIQPFRIQQMQHFAQSRQQVAFCHL